VKKEENNFFQFRQHRPIAIVQGFFDFTSQTAKQMVDQAGWSTSCSMKVQAHRPAKNFDVEIVYLYASSTYYHK
jgi:hypothetical protein